MRLVLAIMAFVLSDNLLASSTEDDDFKYLILEKEGEQVKIEQGDKVFVKVDYYKYKGVLKILNDSTIQVAGTPIYVSDIDMISSPKTGKSVGLVFAQLPVLFTGFVLAAYGIPEGEIGIALGGIATMGIGITAAALEGGRGKRYHAYSRGSNDGSVNRKWSYSIVG